MSKLDQSLAHICKICPACPLGTISTISECARLVPSNIELEHVTLGLQCLEVNIPNLMSGSTMMVVEGLLSTIATFGPYFGTTGTALSAIASIVSFMTCSVNGETGTCCMRDSLQAMRQIYSSELLDKANGR